MTYSSYDALGRVTASQQTWVQADQRSPTTSPIPTTMRAWIPRAIPAAHRFKPATIRLGASIKFAISAPLISWNTPNGNRADRGERRFDLLLCREVDRIKGYRTGLGSGWESYSMATRRSNLKSFSILPVPKTTLARGSSAMDTGNPVS